MHRKHERCAQISGITIAALMLFAVAHIGGGAETKNNIIGQFDKKIEEKNLALDSIRKQLDRGRDKISSLSTREGSYLEQLGLLEKNIYTSHEYLLLLSSRIDTLTLNISQLKDTLQTIETTLARRQRIMENRLRTIYKKGKPGVIEIISTSQSVADALNRIHYFQKINRYDRLLLRFIDSTKTVVIARKLNLEQRQQELLTLKASKQREKYSLEKEQQYRKILLDQVKAEKKAYNAMVKELENAQTELNELIKILVEKRKLARNKELKAIKTVFEKLKGKLPWPTTGSITRVFGKVIHPVYKTITMNNGIDITAPLGNKVICVAQGIVDYIGWMRGYGKFVIINHFNGYSTIYAHLDKIMLTPDQDVVTGEQIGEVGESGSLTGAKLHFQIRQASESLDPGVWLKKKEP
jgi:septal ring factor EnvC (AmiA/AmiB activator)